MSQPAQSTTQAQWTGLTDATRAPELRPLTARSVILSVLLGSHPPTLPVRALVRTAALFGISEGTTRVALSRLSAEGEVVAVTIGEQRQAGYRLSERLVARQRRQDQARNPETRPWRGSWETVIAGPQVRGSTDLSDLAARLAQLRLAELRSGVWMRPANLVNEWPENLEGRVRRFESRLQGDDQTDKELAASLWDLDGWARGAEVLLDTLKSSRDPADWFVISAAIVRHVQEDPLLPPALLPRHWPGRRLRSAYARAARSLAELIRDEMARHEPGLEESGEPNS